MFIVIVVVFTWRWIFFLGVRDLRRRLRFDDCVFMPERERERERERESFTV